MKLEIIEPNKFKALRQANSITCQMLADVCYVTKQTVSNYETGNVSMSVSALLTYGLREILKERRKEGKEVYEII